MKIIRFSFIYRIALTASLGLIASATISAQQFKLHAVTDLVRVFEDGYRLPPLFDTLKVFGIKDEVISGQSLIIASRDLNDVTVEVSALKHNETGVPLPPESVEWNFTGSVLLGTNASNQSESAVTRKAPARFPDYLMSEEKINIKRGVHQTIWITFSIPLNAKAGIYYGSLSVISSSGSQSIPVHLTVYPLTMPAERHLKVTEWYTTGHFERFHGIKEAYSEDWFDMLRVYAENMAAHRQNVFQVPMNSIEITRNGEGVLGFDFSNFDRIAGVFWDTGKMDYLETGELARFRENWYSREIVLRDFRVRDTGTGQMITLPGSEVMPRLMPSFEAHLRKRGWLDTTLFHVKDEPTLHNAESWLEMSRYINRLAPDLIRIDAMNNPLILDELEIGAIMIDNLDIQYRNFSRKQNEGSELWFYTTGLFQASSYPNKTLDVPLMDSRIMHWINYKYDLSGYLHWGWNHWTENPYEDPGEHLGDGWHVYPVKDGILNSMRWEQMRNGIQDYEYFWLLEDKISSLKDSLGSRFSWIDPAYRGKEIAGRIVGSFSERTTDPVVLYRAKEQLVKEILDFEIEPRIYVQIHPHEYSVMKSRSGVEVFGWTEPGTKITINNSDIPVTDQGLFMQWLALYPQSNTVTIEATNEHGSRKIIRTYNIVP